MYPSVRALSPTTGQTPAFPDGFVWGAATSAYQVEGATTEEGRGPSIWDTFCRTPGRVRSGDTGDVAADHYHRMAQDVALMHELGLKSYRFSVAWPRIRPDGIGPVNEPGLDFYRRLVDALLEAGIAPFVTLYHWDLPQSLQDAGGWANRETAQRFAEYAADVYRALGDRVIDWATLNEPWCSAFMGYGDGQHAPGVCDPQEAVRAAHHLLLGHGLAVQSMRSLGHPDRRVGIVLNPAPVHAASSSNGDVDAARRMDGVLNRLFLDPVLSGAYPPDVLADFEEGVDLSHVHTGDEATIGTPIDLLGVNYYRSYLVAGNGSAEAPAAWPGGGRVRLLDRGGPRTAMGWEIDASGLTELLVHIHRSYPSIPVLVTENGAAYDDRLAEGGRVHDPERIEYLDRHLRAVRRAMEAGVDVRGYFVWSLLDNFEWAEGYARRFGLVYVDYPTQRRIPKDSAAWYQAVIASGGPTAGESEGAGRLP
jgi:beta-glucosidase